MRQSKFGTIALVALLSANARAQSDPLTIDRIIANGKTRNSAPEILREICKTIGPRVTGGPRFTKAVHWAKAKFESFGITDASLFQWGEVPVSFERGPNMWAKMVSPYEMPLVFTAAAWTAGTNGPRRAFAIEEPTTLAELESKKAELAGKWILKRLPTSMRAGRRAAPMIDEQKQKDPAAAEQEAIDYQLDAAGIAGRVYGAQNAEDWVHTHGTWQFVANDKLPTDVRVVISNSEMRKIRRQIVAGKPVELEFNVDQTCKPGPVPVYNVIAEIKGSEKPDEVVILGAHLDSWDGPGSEGASDNGTGSSAVLGAARLLMMSHAKPKRTIRFILFGGEEQGLLGSAGYANSLGVAAEKISAVFVEDGGSNKQGSLTANQACVAMLEKAVADTNRAFPDFPIKINPTKDWPIGGGTDHASFNKIGVPGFAFGKEANGKQRYGYIWHTQNDTFENAIPENLIQMSTNMALIAYNIACADTMLPRAPKKS